MAFNFLKNVLTSGNDILNDIIDQMPTVIEADAYNCVDLAFLSFIVIGNLSL